MNASVYFRKFVQNGKHSEFLFSRAVVQVGNPDVVNFTFTEAPDLAFKVQINFVGDSFPFDDAQRLKFFFVSDAISITRSLTR